MSKQLNINNLSWIDAAQIGKKGIEELLQNHGFHELDVEACLEGNQRSRIDTYNDYMFIVMHFPKYELKTKTYKLNEFNVFLRKDLLITLQNYNGTHIQKIFDKYSELSSKKDYQDIKLSSGYILYEVIQMMLEKMFKVIHNIKKDLKEIEDIVFEKPSSSLVKQIMIKKRNIIVLKHMFLPQVSVMKQLESNMNNLFKGEIEVYFEDLEDKLEQIVSDIRLLEEHTESIEDAFKSIIDIRTGKIITFLTIFSAFMLPLTFITSFYGMNIDLPFQNNPLLILSVIFITIFVMILGIIGFRKRGGF